MPAVARIDPKTVFTPEEWSRLTSRSSWRGMWLVAHAWGTIAASIALVTIWPNPLTWLLAVMIVGTRQLGLAILMHEAAHGGLHCEQGDQRICRTMAVRGAGRRRSRELPLLSSAASPLHPAAGRPGSFAVGAVPDHQGQLSGARRSAISPGRPLSSSGCRCSCRCSSAATTDEPVDAREFRLDRREKMARFLGRQRAAVRAVLARRRRHLVFSASGWSRWRPGCRW